MRKANTSEKAEKITKITSSQKEIRTAFLGGFAGQFISGTIWLVSSAISLLVKPYYGMLFLFFGSMFIFPLMQVFLRLLGRPAKVSPENGLWGLGSQVAFIVPICFLLIVPVTLYKEIWFYPAAMIIVGAHYLPFITLYGMKMFAALAGILVIGGVALALYSPAIFSLGGWIAGVILIVFAFIGRSFILREEKNDLAIKLD